MASFPWVVCQKVSSDPGYGFLIGTKGNMAIEQIALHAIATFVFSCNWANHGRVEVVFLAKETVKQTVLQLGNHNAQQRSEKVRPCMEGCILFKRHRVCKVCQTAHGEPSLWWPFSATFMWAAMVSLELLSQAEAGALCLTRSPCSALLPFFGGGFPY